jgi:hypothetical protein
MIFFVTNKINKIYIHQSLRKLQRVLSWYHEYLLYLGQTRTQKTIRNTMRCSDLTQDVEHWTLIFDVSFVKYIKWQRSSKRIIASCLLPPKIAESDTVLLSHGLCGFGGSIYNKYTNKNTLSSSLLALTMINPATQYRLIWNSWSHKWFSNINPGFVS